MKRILPKKFLCRKCGKNIRNGLSKYCWQCKRESERLKRKKETLKRKNSPATLKKECDTLFSKYIRARDGRCLMCGKKENLQCAHLIRRSNLAHRYDEASTITLCYACHIHFFHKEPVGAMLWLEMTYPKTYAYCRLHVNDVQTKKLDYNILKTFLLFKLKKLKLEEK